MIDIFEGNICLLEQEGIKNVINKINDEMILCMYNECWEKLQDIIYFKSKDGKVTSEWSAFLNFVSENSKEMFDSDKFDNIINDLEKKHEHELNIDEKLCSYININIILIKNEFMQKIVEPTRILLDEWNDKIKSKNKNLDVNLDEWAILYNELKAKFSVFINLLWEKILDDIIFEYILENKKISVNITKLQYEFDI